MKPKIALIATLDTKWEEAETLRKFLGKRKCDVVLFDPGMLGYPKLKAEVCREDIAEAGGWNYETLRGNLQKGTLTRLEAIEIMSKGLEIKLSEKMKKIAAVIALGGSTGTALSMRAIKTLPIGFPKVLLVTTILTSYIEVEDVIVFQTPCDMMGLNPVLLRTLQNAANAVWGLVHRAHQKIPSSGMVAITALGLTTSGVMKLSDHLKNIGFHPVVFHSKTDILDRLSKEQRIQYIIDFTPSELTRMFLFRPNGVPEVRQRLVRSSKRRTPLIFIPGGLDMHILPSSVAEVPPFMKERRIYSHGPNITLVRTTKSEMRMLGRKIVKYLHNYRGKVVIVVPRKGLSDMDVEGKFFYDPEADGSLVRELRKGFEDKRVVEINSHINSDEFVRGVAEEFVKLACK
jgi:uncharacterized protein (UPF0261 family)